MVHRLGILLLVALAVGACHSRVRLKRSRITFEQFVNATVQLRHAARETPSPAAFQARKREIEQRLQVTDADLREFSRAYAQEPQYLSAAWDSVEERLIRLTAPNGASPPIDAGPGVARQGSVSLPDALPDRPRVIDPAVLKATRGNDTLPRPSGKAAAPPPGAKPFY